MPTVDEIGAKHFEVIVSTTKKRNFNWVLWLGFALSLFAFLSYYLIFIWFPPTRDFPSANLLLIAGAIVLLVIGWRRAFADGRTRMSKIVATIFTSLGILVCALFVFGFFVAGRWLPSSQGAPHVGQTAPDFTLQDSNGKSTSLKELLATPIDNRPPKGVLLIFYRGYW